MKFLDSELVDMVFCPSDAVASRKNAYNWLTGSQDTFADYSASSASDQSSLLFSVGAGKKTGRGRRAAGKKATDPGFGKERLKANQARGTDEPDSKPGEVQFQFYLNLVGTGTR